MGNYEFTISLRIRHPTIAPAEITRNLGIEPQHAWQAGDPRRNPAGVEINGTYRESYWMARLMAKPELAADRVSVESEVLRTLATLRRAFGFLVTLKAEGGVADLHVNIFAREEFSLEFLPESLSLLGRLGLTVAIEVKPHPLEVGAVAPSSAPH
ncbi:MAG: DUF4279 domain-containing protein [Steroidobacteraceae bacterium]|jgi:hypothetical protein